MRLCLGVCFRQARGAFSSSSSFSDSPWVSLGYTENDIGKKVSKQDVSARFRELAKTHHPDAGGDAAQFHTIKSAYEAVKHGGRIARIERIEREQDHHTPSPAPQTKTAFYDYWSSIKPQRDPSMIEQEEMEEYFRLFPETGGTMSGYVRYMTGEGRRNLRAGTVLMSRVVPDPRLGRLHGEPPQPPGVGNVPAVVFLFDNVNGTSRGMLLNRGHSGGPYESTIPCLHQNRSLAGKRRLARGLYTGGTPPSPEGTLSRDGMCVWRDFALEREISAGLWSVHREIPFSSVAQGGSGADLEDSPELQDKDPRFDVTEERFQLLKSLLEYAVFGTNPWR